MANVFLTNEFGKDVETAIMLEQAIIHNIGKAVAYTDGKKVFINTEDNLHDILPAYDTKFLKWLLWHERYHKELRHHNRFFKYLDGLSEAETKDKFKLSKEEVNIIMDILVHDSLSKMFPELVESAINNLAQMRNRNSLKYTFTTFTLEEMLDEYKEHKKDEDKDKTDESSTKPSDDPIKKSHSKTTTDKESEKPKEDKKEESASDDDTPSEEMPTTPEEPAPEHDKTDWSKLDDIDTKEFIDSMESSMYMAQIEELRRKKIRLAQLTETLNGLATATRIRTYRTPSHLELDDGLMLKGSMRGRAQLYLCFDASGSMGDELSLFKDIISKSIPHAMDVPCEWFTGKYGKGKFKDIMHVHAWDGFDDDGDRTIELCWKAEQKGYSPIGITDGGGRLSWSKPKLKQLKRTIIVSPSEGWIERVKDINPAIQVIHV